MSGSSRPETPPEQPFDLSPRELGRWAWRQLTSMRTALILLFLLALAAIPGSVVPQTGVDSLRASRWQEQHKQLTPIYEKLGLFHVYSSPWFAAIYLMLVVSLVGCILPRSLVYWRGLKAQPPAAPRNLSRLPEHRQWETDAERDVVLTKARAVLRKHRYRLAPEAPDTVSAERGFLREAGNLVFHVSVLVVLAGFALGALFGFKGGVIVVTKESFSNSLSQYDDFVPGAAFSPDKLAPFSFSVDHFDVTFITAGRSAGSAHKFYADLKVRDTPTSSPYAARVSVNHPLTVDGTKVFLIGHGYAPHITVRDGKGHVAYSGPTVFLPESEDFRSFGVVKVPDAKPAQIGLEGEFYPTYAFTDATGPFSAFPDAKNPAISMLAYRGDLGLDGGNPQSVYALDKAKMKPIMTAAGKPLRIDLAMGGTKTLPGGLGSVTFDGLSRFVRLQVSKSPGSRVALAGMVLALIGLLGSLFIRPRRVWVRVRREGDRTIAELAGLDRSSGGDLCGELDELTGTLATDAPEAKEKT
ncbi:MAG: cytochrome c biogenesis protein ResB [Actinomycetota bacterium]|nr:cytochrome c biogenesis protein ResB [Actinomycetota bacterium]